MLRMSENRKTLYAGKAAIVRAKPRNGNLRSRKGVIFSFMAYLDSSVRDFRSLKR